MKYLEKILLTALYLFLFSCDNGPTGSSLPLCPENTTSGADYFNDNNYCYSNEDIEVLQDFINSSIETLNVDPLDWWNDDGVVQWYELGYQEWNNGRLTVLNVNVIPYNSDITYNSNLSGEIPTSISNWTEIVTLNLNYYPITPLPSVRLSGNIPIELGSLTNLKELYLNNNLFSGQLPDVFENLNNLEILWLDNNQLDGPIPESLWNLVNLKQLYLEHNQFSGGLSSNVGNLVNLEHFWINHNSFSGILPDEIFNLDKLIKLKVNNNLFEGSISGEIDNLFLLEVVDFSFNSFQGLIPESICNLNIDFQGSWSDLYYLYDINNFGVSDNNFCPNDNSEYPLCIQNYIGNQNIDNCNTRNYNFIPKSKRYSNNESIK